MDAARDESDEYAVAAGDRALDDLSVVGRSGHDGDPVTELGELADALVTAHRDDLVPLVQRVLNQVLPELAGRPDDAYLRRGHAIPAAGLGATTSLAAASGAGS